MICNIKEHLENADLAHVQQPKLRGLFFLGYKGMFWTISVMCALI